MAKRFRASQPKFPNGFFLLIFLFFACNGCVLVNYQNVIEKYDIDVLQESKSPNIHFTFKPEPPQIVNAQDPLIRILYPFATTLSEYERLGTAVKEYSVLQEVLGKVGEAKILESIPTEGIFVEVSTRLLTGSNVSKVFCGISTFAIAYILPCYTDTFGIVTKFVVSKKGETPKSFSYYIRPQKFIWLGFIPFAWVNYLLPQYEDAFRAVSRRFVHDAAEDGFL